MKIKLIFLSRAAHFSAPLPRALEDASTAEQTRSLVSGKDKENKPGAGGHVVLSFLFETPSKQQQNRTTAFYWKLKDQVHWTGKGAKTCEGHRIRLVRSSRGSAVTIHIELDVTAINTKQNHWHYLHTDLSVLWCVSRLQALHGTVSRHSLFSCNWLFTIPDGDWMLQRVLEDAAWRTLPG